jgi:hypothetical protein
MAKSKSSHSRCRKLKRKICHCTSECRRLLTYRTRQRHYKALSSNERLQMHNSKSEMSGNTNSDIEMDNLESEESQVKGRLDGSSDLAAMDVEEIEGDDSDGGSVDHASESEWSFPEDDEWNQYNENDELDAEGRFREFEEILDSESDAEENLQEELTVEDLDNFQAFKLHVFARLPRTAFNQMRHAFQHHMEISSLYVISQKLAILSGITPQWYDCCVNSCVLYVNDYEDLEQCPECSQPRWISGTHRPR